MITKHLTFSKLLLTKAPMLILVYTSKGSIFYLKTNQLEILYAKHMHLVTNSIKVYKFLTIKDKKWYLGF
ncbi:hypothetical protein CTM94_01785 [Photobacterium leiognathi]|uniref:Uncharacterized protein n=1 Tax=Photobacterium leiognathi TaxID=553611 RepID=A0ABX5GL51_PHOLE|nr:hypothetical protein CTM94_01785 [Photobacterium leiognathi]